MEHSYITLVLVLL